MGQIGLGVVILGLALTAQYLIWKRLKDASLRKVYAWIAWVGTYVGGAAISTDVGSLSGVTAAGATLVSGAMLLFIGVDLKDRRPDWPAFILMSIAPLFMRMTAGGMRGLCDLVLMPADFAANFLSTFLGI